MNFEDREYSKKEVETYDGSYDKDGFFILKDGDFFDPYGFYFDKSGCDKKGGQYDPKTGYYKAPLSTRNSASTKSSQRTVSKNISQKTVDQKVCRDFMENKCTRDDQCRFLHDSEICYHYWKFYNCKFGEKCKKSHEFMAANPEESKIDNSNQKENIVPNKGKLQDQSLPKNESKKQPKTASRSKKNTVDFKPCHDPADMRVLVSTELTKFNLSITSRDVILVPHLFKNIPNIYNKILQEIHDTAKNEDKLWKSIHNDSHFIADDKIENWKDKSRTFKAVIDRIREYFGIDIKATRLNWFKDQSEWKPYHHDVAAKI